METGKLPSELLEKYIFSKSKKSSVRQKEVVVRPNIGEDCSILDLGNELLILSTDPITGACENIGKLLVNINANDVYSSGCLPIGLLITLLLPTDITEEMLKKISDDLFNAAEKAGLEILGGHTEITDAVVRPVVSATVVGKSLNRRYIKTSGAMPGQDVVMTKYAALEGTSILVCDNEDKLKSLLPSAVFERAKALSEMLSVKTEGLIGAEHGASSMHDVTEGGILGACYEIAEASGVGIDVYADKIPILDETRQICELFHVDPLRLISSGSMLIASFDGEGLVKKLEMAGVKGTIIGKITEGEKKIISGNSCTPLGEPEADMIYKAYLDRKNQ